MEPRFSHLSSGSSNSCLPCVSRVSRCRGDSAREALGRGVPCEGCSLFLSVPTGAGGQQSSVTAAGCGWPLQARRQGPWPSSSSRRAWHQLGYDTPLARPLSLTDGGGPPPRHPHLLWPQSCPWHTGSSGHAQGSLKGDQIRPVKERSQGQWGTCLVKEKQLEGKRESVGLRRGAASPHLDLRSPQALSQTARAGGPRSSLPPRVGLSGSPPSAPRGQAAGL